MKKLSLILIISLLFGFLLTANYSYASNPGNKSAEIDVSPDSFNYYIPQGDSIIDSLVITNTGDSLLNWIIPQYESYDSTSWQHFPDGYGTSTTHEFHTGLAFTDIDMVITINGDFDHDSEYAQLYVEGEYYGVIPDGDVTNGIDIVEEYTLSSEDVNNYTSDGVLSVTVQNSYEVNNGNGGEESHEVQISFDNQHIFTTAQDSGAVQPGNSQIIDITFLGTMENGYYEDMISINSNASSSPNLNIPVIINVGEPPTADFTVSDSSGYVPLNVDFYDNSSGSPITQWQWDVDNDGIVDYTTENCNHTYDYPGYYDVKLTVSNKYGTDEIIRNNFISVGYEPDIEILQDSLNVVITQGDSATENLNIFNYGLGNLSWEEYGSTQKSDVIFNDGFEDGSISPFTVTTTSYGRGVIVTSSPYPHSGSRSLRMDTSYNGYNSRVRTELAYDLSPYHPSYLKIGFWYWNSGSEGTDERFMISNDNGSTWHVQEYLPTTSGWTYFEYDFSDYAYAVTSNMRFRWQYYDDYSWGSDGLAIDDVMISYEKLHELNPVSGTIAPYGNEEVEVTFYANLLNYGVHKDTIKISSNDPDEPLIKIPVNLYVGSPPVVDFTASDTTGFAPFTVNFTDQSTGVYNTAWQWDVDNDGGVDYTTQNCTHTYEEAGQYTVKLQVFSPWGNDDSIKTNYINVEIEPDIDIEPQEYIVNLLPDSSLTDSLLISNTGDGQLNWQIDYESTSKSNPQVLIMSAGHDPTTTKNEIVSTGKFNAGDIDLLEDPSGLTLNDIADYDAILVYGNQAFSNPANVGDVLKEYVDNGGGVIITTYCLSSTWAIDGGILDAYYSPFLPAGTQSVAGIIDMSSLPEPEHSIFADLTEAPDYWSNYNYSNPTLNTGGNILAYDTSGNKVVAENDDKNVVGIVIYSGYLDDCNAATKNMYANSLHYVATKDVFVSAEPESGSINSLNQQYIDLTFDASYKLPGAYENNILLSSNDPDESNITIPVTMVVSEQAPTADFEANQTTGTTPFSVEFSDLSTGYPANWEWDINNDGSIDYTTQNCTHVYQQEGLYSVKLKVWNNTGVDSLILTDYITVNNSAPILENPISDISFNEDTVYDSINLNNVFSDPDGDSLSFSVSGEDYIDVQITDGQVTLTPDSNWFGSDTLVFAATEMSLAFSKRTKYLAANRAVTSDTVVVTVESVNDLPYVENSIGSISFMRNNDYTTVNLNTVFNDIDSDLEFSVENENHLGYLINSDSTVTLTPETDWYGCETLHFKATDGMEEVIDIVEVTVNREYLFTEDFNHSGSVPAGWTTQHLGSTEYPWQIYDEGADDYAYQVKNTFLKEANERLISTNYDLTQYYDLSVSFFCDYLPNSSSSAYFQISTDGVTWTTLATFSDSLDETVSYDISSEADGESYVQFRWVYSATSFAENHWLIDDFSIQGIYNDLTEPTVINDLAVANFTINSISLSWTPTSDEFFSDYEIYYSTDSTVTTDDSLWDYTDDNDLSYIDTDSTLITNLLENTRYWFAIRSIDSYNNYSDFSNIVNKYTSIKPVLSDPYPAMPLPLWNNRTVEIGITVKDDYMVNANSIQYRIDANGNGIYDSTEVWNNVSGYSDSDSILVRTNVTYNADGDSLRYEFRAQDTFGSGYAYSGLDKTEGIEDDYIVRIDTTEPTVINDLYLEGLSENSIALSWTPTTEAHFRRYEIYLNDHPNIDTDDSLWTSIHDPDLSKISTNSTIIYFGRNDYLWFRIRAVDWFGNASELSNEVVSVPVNIPPTCDTPNPASQPDPEFDNSLTVTIGCTFKDYFGIDEGTVQYRIDADGNNIYDVDEPWQDYSPPVKYAGLTSRKSNFKQRNENDTLAVSLDVQYEVEGDSLSFEFRAWDVDGYGPTYSGESSILGIEDDWIVKIDTTAPAPINTFASGTTTETSIEVGWLVSSDLHFDGYEVYYDINPNIGLTDSVWDKNDDPLLADAGTDYVVTEITDLEPGTTYYFRVRAIDEAGNSCDLSYEISEDTDDLIQYYPLAPTNLNIALADSNVVLSWNEVTQNTNGDSITVDGYKIYQSGQAYFDADAGTYEASVVDTTWTHVNVADLVEKIFYKVRAYQTEKIVINKNLENWLRNRLSKSIKENSNRKK